MTIILFALTGVSLLLVVALAGVLRRTQQIERRRSEARTALLREAAGIPPAASPVSDDVVEERVAAHDDMFARREPASALAARAAAAVVFASCAALIGLALLPARPDTASSRSAAGAEPGPLELVALEHAPEASALTISGIARNPQDARALRGITVVASALDREGQELARGDAALARATLEPGSESAFVVKMAVDGRVSRFRVGFRAADGTPIPHVDRRPDGISAREQRSSRGDQWVQ